MDNINISLKRSEMAILAFNLNTMNKNIKKGLKGNYAPSEAKKHIKNYNEVKEYINNELNVDQELYQLTFNQEKTGLLYSFLNWFIEELKLDADINEFDYKDNEILSLLESTKLTIENEINRNEKVS